MDETVRVGSCLCGQDQFEVIGEPFTMTYCHCESCRRWVGAPVMAVQVPDLKFRPRLQTNYAEKVVSVYDGLPKYKDFDPALHGKGEEMPE